MSPPDGARRRDEATARPAVLPEAPGRIRSGSAPTAMFSTAPSPSPRGKMLLSGFFGD